MSTVTSEKAKTIEIIMSERRPLKIDPSVWTLIAQAEYYNGQHRSQANTIRQIKVRQHEDGRRIVYGMQFAGNGGQHAGTRNPAGGFLLSAVDINGKPCTNGYPDEDGTVRAIRRVGGIIEDDGLAAECIADLPAEEI